MDRHAVATEAWVEASGSRIPIEARYGSKFSLWVRFPDGASFPNGQEFERLSIIVDEETNDFGPSRLIWETNIEGYAGRLVLTDDIQDFAGVFFSAKPVTLESAFFNVSLLLNHKESIRDAFKDYVADLAYDLSVYQNAFDSLEAEFSEEAPEVRAQLEDVVFRTEGEEMRHFLDEQQGRLVALVDDLGKTEGQRHGFYFRRQLWNIILLVPLMARTNLKPRGYAGDSEMMRMLYAQDYEGDSLFARILHKHAIDQSAAEAVRNRRSTIARWFTERFSPEKLANGSTTRMLSVACGPAYELQDILHTKGASNRLSVTLFDQDQYALLEAARLVDRIERELKSRMAVDYLRESVRTMLVAPHLRERWGDFDLIYSMGLFDYLTVPVAKAVLGRLYELLNPGGEMMIGNFHENNPNRQFMEYWLDWVIYHRNEEEFLALASDLPSTDVSVHTDETGIQMFLKVRKTK